MGAAAASWIWEHSRAANGSLIVLLAIADECGEGEFVEMSVAELARKARLSDKGVRRAVKDLEALGELSVESRAGGSSRYALTATPVKMTGGSGQNDRGRQPRSKRPAGQNDRGHAKEPQVSGTPVKMTGPEISNVITTGRSTAEVKEAPAKPERDPNAGRPDVDRLCARLADRIAANGANRPNITRKWKDAARLMLDNDNRTENQVRNMIDWCQSNEFWRSNILSMPKLREKYSQLKMQAERELGIARQPEPYQHAPAPAGRPRMPQWCGRCNERTRFLDVEPPRRCPDCHPAYAQLQAP